MVLCADTYTPTRLCSTQNRRGACTTSHSYHVDEGGCDTDNEACCTSAAWPSACTERRHGIRQPCWLVVMLLGATGVDNCLSRFPCQRTWVHGEGPGSMQDRKRSVLKSRKPVHMLSQYRNYLCFVPLLAFLLEAVQNSMVRGNELQTQELCLCFWCYYAGGSR